MSNNISHQAETYGLILVHRIYSGVSNRIVNFDAVVVRYKVATKEAPVMYYSLAILPDRPVSFKQFHNLVWCTFSRLISRQNWESTRPWFS